MIKLEANISSLILFIEFDWNIWWVAILLIFFISFCVVCEEEGRYIYLYIYCRQLSFLQRTICLEADVRLKLSFCQKDVWHFFARSTSRSRSGIQIHVHENLIILLMISLFNDGEVSSHPIELRNQKDWFECRNISSWACYFHECVYFLMHPAPSCRTHPLSFLFPHSLID